MLSTSTIGTLIWLIGAVVAWFQIRYWNRDLKLRFPRDYVILTVMSLLSWLVYPIYAIEWLSNGNNN